MRDTYLATRVCGGAGRRLGCYRPSAEIGESDLLGVAGHPVQELLGGVEGSDVTRDEDGLPGEVYDCGHAGSVRVEPRGVLLEPLRRLQQAVVLFAVKLVDGRETRVNFYPPFENDEQTERSWCSPWPPLSVTRGSVSKKRSEWNKWATDQDHKPGRRLLEKCRMMDRKQGRTAELRRWHSFIHQQGNQFRSFVQKSSSHRLHVSINKPESAKEFRLSGVFCLTWLLLSQKVLSTHLFWGCAPCWRSVDCIWLWILLQPS